VFVLDDLSTGNRDAVDPRAGFTLGSILDQGALEAALAPGTDAVVHLAAAALVAESMIQPGYYYRTNVVGGLNVLDSAAAIGVGRFVFASTCAVYGEPVRLPIDEMHPTSPTNVYGESKLAFERALAWYGETHGIQHASLRFFNVCGATEELGERRKHETHIIPLALEAALNGDTFRIFGDNYPTKDGSCVRDYVHVSDIADAHIAVLEGMDSVARPAYNIGSGTGHSNLEVVDAVRRVTRRELRVEIAGRRAGDPAALVASGDALFADLGWHPAITTLDEMVASAWRWRQVARG
jgi:UDP-glucose 4-epimerase